MSLDGEEGSGKVMIGLWMSNVAKSHRSLTAGEWNHVGATYDGALLKLYINGQADTVTSVHLVTEPLDGRIGNLVRKSSDLSRVQTMPHIWHEFNNVYAGSLPDLTIAAKYTGVIQNNHCVAFHVQEMADNGLTQRYPDIRKRSHYGALPVKDGKLTWKVSSGSQVVQEGVFEGVNIDVGQVQEIGQISITPSTCNKATKLTLEAQLVSSACAAACRRLQVTETRETWTMP